MPIENQNKTELNNIREKNIRLEDDLTNSRKLVFVLSIAGVVLMLVSLGFFLLKF